jgi:phosphatidylserine/phosphatidylglycerophosphate/cardiolipin synthase-like enzyme
VGLAKNKYSAVLDRPRWLQETKREITAALSEAQAKNDAALAALPALHRENVPRFYPIVFDPVFDKKQTRANKISAAMLETIRRAKKEIILTQNYLNPPEAFLKALTAAAERGVKVKILTTGQKDSGLSVWPYITACRNYKAFVTSGAEIYETNGLPEHSKVLVADGAVAAFGSFNVEIAADQSLVEGMCFSAAPDIVLLLKAAALDAILAGRRIDEAELARMNVPKKFRLFDRAMSRVTKPIL